MNYINLLELIKGSINYDIFKTLKDSFAEDFQAEYKSLRPCKSASEKAIKNYVGRAIYKGEKTATYGDGHTVLILGKYIPEAENEKIRVVDLEKPCLEMMKDKQPTHCYFMDCIALYKTLKKQENRDYFLELDGHVFNAALVAEMVQCIATKKETYIHADLCKLSGTDARALFISQGSGAAAIILPVRGKVVKIGENINTQVVFKYTGSIEDALFDESLKSMREGA